MDNWQKMFQGVQAIAQSARTVEEGLILTVQLALSDTNIFDNSAYWNRVDSHITKMPLDTVISWAREGLERLESLEGWDFLISDFGDCPEIFQLYRLGCQLRFSEEKFRKLSFSQSVIGFDEFAKCFVTNETNVEEALYSHEHEELTYHNVRELKDDILTWNVDSSVDFNGDNGYLLWLSVGSLALLEPLRDIHYCKTILRGRQRLYLLSGFEEMFLYLATVTPEGLRFEEPKSSL